MARCIAFDKPTAQAVSRNLHMLTICDTEANPVEAALQSNAPTSLLALPVPGGKHVLIARFRRLTSNEPSGFEASGFLGLSDQPVYAPELPPVKKWWQKFLE